VSQKLERHAEELDPATAMLEHDGLAALLDYARRLPACAPEDIPGVYEGAPGLGGLLWECRRQTQDLGEEQ
jgi:hypothetical protein